MLSYGTVESHTLELLKAFMRQDLFASMRLVGGTALALQYGHRQSVDLDMFGPVQLDSFICAVILCIDNINAKAPYQTEYAVNKAFVIFSTDYGAHYLVGFEYDDTSFSFETYQLVIINSNNKKSPRDAKVKETIIAIVESVTSSYECGEGYCPLLL